MKARNMKTPRSSATPAQLLQQCAEFNRWPFLPSSDASVEELSAFIEHADQCPYHAAILQETEERTRHVLQQEFADNPTVFADLLKDKANPARLEKNRSEERPRLRLIKPTPKWLAAAAVIVLLVGVGMAFWLRPTTIAAPLGEKINSTLPDGSQVHLNSGTSLTYARSFGFKTRKVRLEGEAFFDVVTDHRSFIVETFNAHVSVLGTRFNVRAWKNDLYPETVVYLESGEVEFSPKGETLHAVILALGQESHIIGENQQPTDPVATHQAPPWRSDRLYFNDQPLGVILAELERRFNTQIITTPQTIRQEHRSLSHDEDLEAILEVICGNIYNYRALPGGYEIYNPIHQ